MRENSRNEYCVRRGGGQNNESKVVSCPICSPGEPLEVGVRQPQKLAELLATELTHAAKSSCAVTHGCQSGSHWGIAAR